MSYTEWESTEIALRLHSIETMVRISTYPQKAFLMYETSRKVTLMTFKEHFWFLFSERDFLLDKSYFMLVQANLNKIFGMSKASVL